MIRRATVEDTDAIVQMGARFLADGPYGRATADQHALDTFVRYLLEYGYVTCSAHGMLLGQSFLNPITAEMTAAEIAWWVDPEHRRGSHDALRLFTAFEDWAAHQHARAIQVIAPVGTSLGHLYARRGYRELETIWQKRLAA